MNAWYKKNAPRLKEKRVHRAMEKAKEKFALVDTPEMQTLRQIARAQICPETE